MKRKTVRISSKVKIVFEPDDPDTPVMVYGTKGARETSSATFFCAADTGELSACGANDEDYYLTESELLLLHTYENEAEDYFNYAREKDPNWR